MKLAEALIIRKDLRTQISHLQNLLRDSAIVQEGEDPAHSPQDLLAEVDHTTAELQRLTERIKRTNIMTLLNGTMNLAGALAERDSIRFRQDAYEELVNAASRVTSRYSKTEIRLVRTVDVAALQREVNAMSRQFRELDIAIQQCNWQTDLLN